MLYETAFENRRKTVVDVFEYSKLLLRLQPGETRHVESRSPRTSYAKWSELVFKDKDRVSFTENKNWEWPWPDKLCLEFINIDGTGTEGLQVGPDVYQSDRGIPKMIPISLRDTSLISHKKTKLCFIQKIERKLVEHKVREGDYIIKKCVLEDVETLRSKKEIRAIQKQLEDAAVEKARREVQRGFLKLSEETPEMEKS